MPIDLLVFTVVAGGTTLLPISPAADHSRH
jgi:hypothetical protein